MAVTGAPRDYSATYRNAVDATLAPLEYLQRVRAQQDAIDQQRQQLAQTREAQADTKDYQNRHLALEGVTQANTAAYQQGELSNMRRGQDLTSRYQMGELSASARRDAETSRHNKVDEHLSALTGEATRAEINARTANQLLEEKAGTITLNDKANDQRLLAQMADELKNLTPEERANGLAQNVISRYSGQLRTQAGHTAAQAVLGDTMATVASAQQTDAMLKWDSPDAHAVWNQATKDGEGPTHAFQKGAAVEAQFQQKRQDQVIAEKKRQESDKILESFKATRDIIMGETGMDASNPDDVAKANEMMGKFQALDTERKRALLANKEQLRQFLNPQSQLDQIFGKGTNSSIGQPLTPGATSSGGPPIDRARTPLRSQHQTLQQLPSASGWPGPAAVDPFPGDVTHPEIQAPAPSPTSSGWPAAANDAGGTDPSSGSNFPVFG